MSITFMNSIECIGCKDILKQLLDSRMTITHMSYKDKQRPSGGVCGGNLQLKTKIKTDQTFVFSFLLSGTLAG